MNQDSGLAALNLIHDRLMIDESWTVRRERGFSWIASKLIQHVDASPLFESMDLQVSQVVIQTRMVERVTWQEDKVRDFVANKNGFAIGSALMFEPATASIDLVLAHTIHVQTLEFRGSLLADMAILQLIEAENGAAALARICGGIAPVGEHPTSGRRGEPDDMLNAGAELFVPAGATQSHFAGVSEMIPIYSYLENSRFASMGASNEGISIEVPFGIHDTTLIELRSDIRHPSLGAGLAVRTTIRLNEFVCEPTALASQLQAEQMRTVEGGGQMGAWGVRPDYPLPHVAWSRFIPNAMFQKGLALDVAIGEINRAEWADRFLYPNLPSRNAWEIMHARETLRRNATRSGPVS